MRLSFVAAVLAMLAFNTVMAAPISIKDQSEVVRDMEEYHVVTTSTALEPANQKSHETQNHEDYPQLVRRDLTAEEHMIQAAAHRAKAKKYEQKADEFDSRLEGMGLEAAERKHLTDGADISDLMSHRHVFKAQAHENFAEAKAKAHGSSEYKKAYEDALLSEEMASQKYEEAKSKNPQLHKHLEEKVAEEVGELGGAKQAASSGTSSSKSTSTRARARSRSSSP
ncbi:hypothetical protein FRB91_004371 [Serendipita sp. 411]|nr:hypothetical protein FRB91_004371 [Serendipita sp. 411]